MIASKNNSERIRQLEREIAHETAWLDLKDCWPNFAREKDWDRWRDLDEVDLAILIISEPSLEYLELQGVIERRASFPDSIRITRKDRDHD